MLGIFVHLDSSFVQAIANMNDRLRERKIDFQDLKV